MRLLTVISFFCLCSVASASTIPETCPTQGTYATLIALNSAGGCLIGDLIFSGFTFSSSATNGAQVIGAADLPISATINSGGTSVGFAFAGIPMSAGRTQTSDVSLGYSVAALSAGVLITSAGLTETGGAIPDTGVATIDENAGPYALHTFLTSVVFSKPADSVAFPAVAFLDVNEHLHVAGGIVGSGAITGFSNSFTEAIPEPASVVLFGIGLAVLGAVRELLRTAHRL